MDDIRLDTLQGLVELIMEFPGMRAAHLGENMQGNLHCPQCGADRRMNVTTLYSPFRIPTQRVNIDKDIPAQIVPSLLTYECVQCDAEFTAVVYHGPSGVELAVFPSCLGGLSTPHTPPGVAFYLDQAHRCQSIGANSAAVAMYRGALEHLLFEQRYRQGTLAAKIGQLDKHVQSGQAPEWAAELDTDFLRIIKDLGNASIHPNDGDVTKQAHIDNKLLVLVKEIFQMLLYLVYEVPSKKAERLSALQSKVEFLK